jgi:hypothetical protein
MSRPAVSAPQTSTSARLPRFRLVDLMFPAVALGSVAVLAGFLMR